MLATCITFYLFIIAVGTFSIFDINNVFVRESYAINQGYQFALLCGISGSSSPIRDEFKWFDSNGNEGKEILLFYMCI